MLSIFQSSPQILIPCVCLAVFATLATAGEETKTAVAAETEKKQDANVEPAAADNGDTVKAKRGLYESLGDYGSFSHGSLGSFGHGSLGHGSLGHGSFGGHASFGHEAYAHGGFESHDYPSEHHHEHVKHITVEKKVPVPYTVTKHIPYTVEKKVSASFHFNFIRSKVYV